LDHIVVADAILALRRVLRVELVSDEERLVVIAVGVNRYLCVEDDIVSTLEVRGL
jgi:hypothetical protein